MQSVVVVSIRTGFRYRASPEASPNPKNAPAGFAGSRDVAIEADGQGEQLSRREQPRSREGGGQRGPGLSAATLPRTSVDGRDRGHHPRRRANLAPSHITCVCPDTQSPRAPWAIGRSPSPSSSSSRVSASQHPRAQHPRKTTTVSNPTQTTTTNSYVRTHVCRIRIGTLKTQGNSNRSAVGQQKSIRGYRSVDGRTAPHGVIRPIKPVDEDTTPAAADARPLGVCGYG